MKVEIVQSDEGYWEIIGMGTIIESGFATSEQAENYCKRKGFIVNYD